jgi:glycosyltransferase involved in cell wall biosynthesis
LSVANDGRGPSATGRSAPLMIPDLSVVIPVRNESANVDPLCEELVASLDVSGRTFEVILIDDGSTDDTFARLAARQERDPRLRVIRFRRNFGQTAAFAAGFAYARGRYIVTSDGDLQNDPRDIARMVDLIEQGHDIVCGWRKDRKDPFLTRRLPSMLANQLISRATGVRLHDYGCSLKVFRAEVVKPLRLYGEMHRFLPAIASEMGVSIEETVVNHRARRHGKSKYGLSRTVRVMLDLLTVKFLLSYSTRPRRRRDGTAGRARNGVARVPETVRVSVDRQPAVAAVRDPADLHRSATDHAGPAGGAPIPNVP